MKLVTKAVTKNNGSFGILIHTSVKLVTTGKEIVNISVKILIHTSVKLVTRLFGRVLGM